MIASISTTATQNRKKTPFGQNPLGVFAFSVGLSHFSIMQKTIVTNQKRISPLPTASCGGTRTPIEPTFDRISGGGRSVAYDYGTCSAEDRAALTCHVQAIRTAETRVNNDILLIGECLTDAQERLSRESGGKQVEVVASSRGSRLSSDGALTQPIATFPSSRSLARVTHRCVTLSGPLCQDSF